MKSILDREGYVVVDPDIMVTPMFRITHAVKDEIRAYKWKQEKMGRSIKWCEARREWLKDNKKAYKHMMKAIFKYDNLEDNACNALEPKP